MRKVIAGGLVALVALFVVGKTTSLCSYAGTLWSQARSEAKRQVPTKFELDRIRHEIASLDSDVNQMIRPVAEYKVVIERLRRDIQRTENTLDDQKKVLLGMTEDLKGNSKVLHYGGRAYSVDTIKTKLNRDFDAFKRAEGHLAAQRKLLDAKEASLVASQEQLVKVLSKKREYEVRLAELEAKEETLQIVRIGNADLIQIDSSRATQIEQALRDIEDRQGAEVHANELKQGLTTDSIPVHERSNATVDLESIRAYLDARQATASNK